MPARAQRRRNQEARAATEQFEARKRAFPDLAAEKFSLRRDFIAEAIRSSGLVSMTFMPDGDSGRVDVFGGKITFDGRSSLRGDSLVNMWSLPAIRGYRISYGKTDALVTCIKPDFTAFDVSNLWLRTADDLLSPADYLAGSNGHEHLTLTRDGLTLLAGTIGHSAVSMGLSYIEQQLFIRDS